MVGVRKTEALVQWLDSLNPASTMVFGDFPRAAVTNYGKFNDIHA
jgi:hypothetical protein